MSAAEASTPGARRCRRASPLDTTTPAIRRYCMPLVTLRLTALEKRRFTAEARQRDGGIVPCITPPNPA